jgi:formylglycine-generating enzyme required for sulfatase activity
MNGNQAVLIGINDYPDNSGLVPLRFAEADARELAARLERACGFKTTLLLGVDATREAIEDAVEARGEGEVCLFFFAGHGQMIKGLYHLHPVNSEAGGKRAIPFEFFHRTWHSPEFRFGKVFAVLDACRNEAVGIRGQRGFSASEARDVLAATHGHRLVEVLYGCQEGQVSFEDESLGHGVLTHGLLGVLDERLAYLDTDYLAGAAADRMKAWSRRDPRHRWQVAHRYAVPSLVDRIVLVGRPPANDRSCEPCPQCGLRQPPEETFRCRRCGRDYLCRTHFVATDQCCESCACTLAQERREQAKRQRQQAEARRREELRYKLTHPVVGATVKLDLASGCRIALCGVPEGGFLLGSTQAEREWASGLQGRGNAESFTNEGEAPRRARIREGFWIGRTAVTMGQFRAFVEATGYLTEMEKVEADENPYFSTNPCFSTNGWDWVRWQSWRDPGYGLPVQDEHPVACVNWNDAVAFCQWATERARGAGMDLAGLSVRLPTEAEWEYACRGGREGTWFWWGHAWVDGRGRMNVASEDKLRHKVPQSARSPKCTWSDGYDWVSPVDAFGEKGRNGYGLADMLGNVWEWCQDGYDPKGAHAELWTQDTSMRLLRGGSFDSSVPGHVRCAYRGWYAPACADAGIGFRVVLGAGG